MEDQLLIEMLKRKVKEELPDFEPDPIMPANQDHAKAVHEYLRMNPKAKRLTPKIATGPTTASIRSMIKSGLNPEEFENTNLLGIFDLKNREIGLSPALKQGDLRLPETIGHEFAHAAGLDSEGVADAAGKMHVYQLMERWDKQKKAKR